MATRWVASATSCTPSAERCARAADLTRPPRHTTSSNCRRGEGRNDALHRDSTNHGGTENKEFKKFLHFLRVSVVRTYGRATRQRGPRARTEPDAPALGQGRAVP